MEEMGHQDFKDRRVKWVCLAYLVSKEILVFLGYRGHKEKRENKDLQVHLDPLVLMDPQEGHVRMGHQVFPELRVTLDLLDSLDHQVPREIKDMQELLVYLADLVKRVIEVLMVFLVPLAQLDLQERRVMLELQDPLAPLDLMGRKETRAFLDLRHHLGQKEREVLLVCLVGQVTVDHQD